MSERTGIAKATEKRAAPRPVYHFSVDDVFDAFVDVSDQGMSLFEHSFFAFLRRLHEQFGVTVDLYLFYRKQLAGRWRTLEEASSGLDEALGANPWLRLGPHAFDRETPPHAQTPKDQVQALAAIYAQLDRFAPTGCRSRWVRLHEFSESYELASYLKRNGVEALLTTDKPAVSYRLPGARRAQLARHGRTVYRGIRLIRSDIRVENLVSAGCGPTGMRQVVDDVLRSQRRAVVMTHEYELERREVRQMTVRLLEYLATRAVSL